MRAILVLLGVAALALLAAMALGLVRLDQTQVAELPRLEGGQAPKFNVDAAKINVGTKEQTVEVPDISVQKPGEAAPQ